VLGPGDPPVRLTVLPFDSVEPATVPPAPADAPAELPPEACAKAIEQVPRYRLKTNALVFMYISSSFGYRWHIAIQPAAAFDNLRQRASFLRYQFSSPSLKLVEARVIGISEMREPRKNFPSNGHCLKMARY
jgi:hypothetical protein